MDKDTGMGRLSWIIYRDTMLSQGILIRVKGGELESENDVVMDAVVQVMQGNEPRNAGSF